MNNPWQEIGRMTFEQFREFISLHGGRSWQFREIFPDNTPVLMMEGATMFVAYRCDNIRLWCRVRVPRGTQQAMPAWMTDNGDGTVSGDF